MNPEEARALVVAAIDKATGAFNDPRFFRRRDDAAADIAFDEIDMDSLTAIEICMAVEEDSGVEIDLADLSNHRSVNALARLIASRSRT